MTSNYAIWTGIVFLVLWLILGGLSAGHAVMYKRDPRSATIWLLVSFTLPIVGPWFYWVFGINRIERAALRRFGRRERPFTKPDVVRVDTDRGVERYQENIGHLEDLRLATDRITRLPLLGGNKITPLHNGEQAYPAMIEAIAQAERSITLASYIFDWDDVGRMFADALQKAARRGVKVHVLIDGIGAVGTFSRMGRLLQRSGAEIASFFPLRFPLGRLRINLRNHRKIMVVDGRRGFTGGINISARHYMDRDNPDRCADLHFEVRGPIVAELQHVFMEDWTTANGSSLEGEEYFPALADEGTAVCRGIAGGPDQTVRTIQLILQAAFAAARHRVRVITPYFVPPSALVSVMTVAALRGVDVGLVLPAKNDRAFMRWAANSYLWQLLEHGVRVFLHPPPFVHTKLTVVDERWVLFGSANLDPRSFRLNFEFNVEAYDVTLARGFTVWLDELASKSHEVTLEEVDSRSGPERLRDGITRLFAPHL